MDVNSIDAWTLTLAAGPLCLGVGELMTRKARGFAALLLGGVLLLVVQAVAFGQFDAIDRDDRQARGHMEAGRSHQGAGAEAVGDERAENEPQTNHVADRVHVGLSVVTKAPIPVPLRVFE